MFLYQGKWCSYSNNYTDKLIFGVRKCSKYLIRFCKITEYFFYATGSIMYFPMVSILTIHVLSLGSSTSLLFKEHHMF